MKIINHGNDKKMKAYDKRELKSMDKEVRFTCVRCGCEYIASLMSGEIINTVKDSGVTVYESHCPECEHPNASTEVFYG